MGTWSVAIQNTRGLRSEVEMRCWKQYLVEEKIDICCATETHMDEEREKLLIDIFEDKFECISKIRKERKKGDYGSGGLAILMRKSKGKIKLVKKKGNEGILWVEVEGTGRKMHLAVVSLSDLIWSEWGSQVGPLMDLQN